LHAYESGERRPQMGFLRRVSAKYRVPFASLLMPEPLPLVERPTDHRMRQRTRPLSLDTLIAIEEVSEALDAFEGLADEDMHLVPRLRLGNATLNDDAEELAARERRRFGVSIDDQRGWKSLSAARIGWRRRIEEHGIFTYMIPMPGDELSGFSLLHNGLAAICVNDNEPSDGAKIFTLFHEYCHENRALLQSICGVFSNPQSGPARIYYRLRYSA
jgi:hypothetical protein